MIILYIVTTKEPWWILFYRALWEQLPKLSNSKILELKKSKNNNYPYNVELLAYDKMGHSLPIPYIIPLKETLSMNMGGGVFSIGGTVEGNAEGQFESWKKTVESFQNAVKRT